ncbi:hypothetical protein L3Q82_006577 [Scortum barcoo]|uniref:Uncharacterized protein n=1 Tax=Scortum barcoo TaxID=214431 RepID=A0ACB8WZR4_9TELE|nr:hypothetical protein L3Q82_006577 [Scortum barcoo]
MCQHLFYICSTKEKTTKDDIVVEMKTNTKNEEAVLLKAVNGDKKGPNEQHCSSEESTCGPAGKCLVNAIHDNGTEWRQRQDREDGTAWSDYVAMCAVEGMETNSRRMFLAVSRLFWAIIRAFWMSWME